MSNVEAPYVRLPDAVAPWVFTDRPVARVLRNRHGDGSGVRGAAWLWSGAAAAPVRPASSRTHAPYSDAGR